MSDQKPPRKISRNGRDGPRSYNPQNEALKRRYIEYMKEADGLSEDAVRHAIASIDDFDESCGRTAFGNFKAEHAVRYKKELASRVSLKTGRGLSKMTQHRSLEFLQNFFRWLADQHGYRARLRKSDADYFSLSRKDRRVASAPPERKIPTLAEIEALLRAMPSGTPLEKRDRAIVAILILTGARVSAVATLRLKHLDLEKRVLRQDPREVRTKFGTFIETFLIEIQGDAFGALKEWVRLLEQEIGSGPDDPLFPKTLMGMSPDLALVRIGLGREGWRSDIPIRRILNHACQAAGLPYFNPHSFRHAVAQLGLARARTAEEMKAWSQNLGHSGMLTTLHHYGRVNRERQGEIIRQMSEQNDEDPVVMLEKLAQRLKRER